MKLLALLSSASVLFFKRLNTRLGLDCWSSAFRLFSLQAVQPSGCSGFRLLPREDAAQGPGGTTPWHTLAPSPCLIDGGNSRTRSAKNCCNTAEQIGCRGTVHRIM